MGFMYKVMTPEEFNLSKQPGGRQRLEEKWRNQQYNKMPKFTWNANKYENCSMCNYAVPEGRLARVICKICDKPVKENNVCSQFCRRY